MTREDVIRMARKSGFLIDGVQEFVFAPSSFHFTEEIERFAALVAAAERKSKPHTLGHGEMEISLRREHNGELFEYRYRFTREQVLHGTPDMIENIAGRLNAAIAQNIHKRGQA
jgi:hypothetical protein